MKRATSDEEEDIYSNSLKRPKMQSCFERLILSDVLRDDIDTIEESQSGMEFERISSPVNSDAASSKSNHPLETIYSEEEPGEEEELKEEELEEEKDEDDEEDDDDEEDEEHYGEEYEECYDDEDDEEKSIYGYQSGPDSEDVEISDFYASDDSDEGNQGIYNFDALYLLLNSWVSLNE
ncbi:hypothetical protein MFLAVUS_006975 [Mucor flavus]|uniref:Transcription factor Iwr1 domain-containing protein n=1 Tax=Mucor flavus TaxID=439312 RepID=A0ABP9Z306_9FUNG